VRNEITIRITGQAGQGMQTIGNAMVRMFKQAGLHVFSNQDYMSRIRGGNNYFQIRVSTQPVFALRQQCDIIVVLDKTGVPIHQDSLSEHGVLIVDKEQFGISDPARIFYDIRMAALTKDLGGNGLSAPVSFSFTTATTTDAVAPVIAETLPPSSAAVWNLYSVEASTKNGPSGALEPLDPATVDDDDVLVTNVTTGLIRRGFHLSYYPGDSTLYLSGGPGRSGFGAEGAGVNLESVHAEAGAATYVTSQAHGLVAGNVVWIYGVNDGAFNAENARVEAVPTTTSFTIPSSCLPSSSHSLLAERSSAAWTAYTRLSAQFRRAARTPLVASGAAPRAAAP